MKSQPTALTPAMEIKNGQKELPNENCVEIDSYSESEEEAKHPRAILSLIMVNG
ncbi:hypothetical protein SH501x_000490 [Pirellulaceae bacterium SH501]